MLVVASALFLTSSRSVVHPSYIAPLRYLSRVHTYSLGSVVLAYLYRGLEHASKKEANSVSGCLLLLILWSYEHFDIGLSITYPTRDNYSIVEHWSRSIVVKEKGKEKVSEEEEVEIEVQVEAVRVRVRGMGKTEVELIEGKKGNGIGKIIDEDVLMEELLGEGEELIEERSILGKWSRRDIGKGPHHSLPNYRGEFDRVGSDNVIWTPYARFHESDKDPYSDVDYFEEDWEAHCAGCARVALLHFDIVEYHIRTEF